MAYTWNLQYRITGTSSWTTGVTGVTKNVSTGELIAAPTGLTMGQTYDFRWQRVNSGTIEAHSNVVTVFLDNTVTDVPSGGSVSSAGTFTLTLGSGGGAVSTTIVRSNSELLLQLSANWDYVTIDWTNNSNVAKKNFASNQSNTTVTGYSKDAAVINKTSNKTIEIYLDKSYTYTVGVKYQGKSLGTITINSY